MYVETYSPLWKNCTFCTPPKSGFIQQGRLCLPGPSSFPVINSMSTLCCTHFSNSFRGFSKLLQMAQKGNLANVNPALSLTDWTSNEFSIFPCSTKLLKPRFSYRYASLYALPCILTHIPINCMVHTVYSLLFCERTRALNIYTMNI